MELTALLKELVARGASDLHIRSDHPAVLRVDGKIVTLDTVLTSQDTDVLANMLMNDELKARFHRRHEVDLAHTFPGFGRFRINIFQQRGVVNMALRVVPAKIPTIAELKLPPAVAKIADNRRGLVLITGTTGSGKSHTLAAIIDHINSTRSENIITIEDPIEFMHEDKKSIISQRELGFDTLTYVDALRNVVRQDPDVILLGEMRDLETVSAAITAAQTGHLVLSTLHTMDTIQSINRIIDLYPPHQQEQTRLLLADTLKAVISQRLLPQAMGTGRVPAVEILVMTQLVRKMIEANTLGDITELMKKGQYYGMQTFNQSLVKLLYQGGDILLEDALSASTSPEELMLAVRGVQSSSENSSGNPEGKTADSAASAEDNSSFIER